VTTTRVCVTGMGAVCCLGVGVDALWEGLRRGACGLGPLTRFALGGVPYGLAGQVEGFDTEADESRGLSRGARFALRACREALAGFPQECRRRLAVVTGSNFGPQEAIVSLLAGGEAPWPAASGPFGAEAAALAGRLDAGGLVASLSLSCASGNAAIAHLLELIRYGRAEAGLACGYDSLDRFSWAGLSALRVMAAPRGGRPAGVRPFDRARNGTAFSEGAGCLLLETEEHARERGAAILAVVAGAGVNNNACHLTHSDEEGSGLAHAMQMALDDAGLEPSDVDHVNAHGTATKLNDVAEARALAAVFDDALAGIPVTSIKGSIGHAMGAAGSLEAIACVRTLTRGIIPPTVGLETRDPDCAVDVVQGAVRRADVSAVLNNAAGIGGANAAVVFRRADGHRNGEGK